MNYENRFELLIAVVFVISPQLGGLGPKAQDTVIPFCLGEGEPLSYFYLRYIASRSKLALTRYLTGQINNLT